MDFESYAAQFSLSSEGQAKVGRRRREVRERNQASQRALEGKRVGDEIERVEKERIEKDLKEATSAIHNEHRRPQQRERAEYQVRRIGPDSQQPWPADGEIREILRMDPRASGAWYGNHFAIRFTHTPMLSTKLLLADAPCETAQAEL